MSDKREHLIDALRAHKSDYESGRTQDFRNVCCDCAAAADEIEKLAAIIQQYTQRFAHLFKSETIRDCDAYRLDGKTHVRNVEELDRQMELLEELLDERKNATSELCVMYLCDRRKCTICREDCTHTEDVRHAKNFELSKQHYSMMIEKEG